MERRLVPERIATRKHKNYTVKKMYFVLGVSCLGVKTLRQSAPNTKHETRNTKLIFNEK